MLFKNSAKITNYFPNSKIKQTFGAIILYQSEE